MPALMGGIRITGFAWVSPTTLQVRFLSEYGGTKHYQLYAGRTLIGVTGSTSARQVVGQLRPSDWPQPITLLAVDPADRVTEFGAQLPRRPYNRVRLRFRADSWPDDARAIDVYAGTTPGGAVDATNRIARELYRTDGEYEVITDPLAGSGTWNFEAQGVDSRPPEGNVGTALALSAVVTAHPPDVVLGSDGKRLSVAIAAGVATVTCTLP